MKRILKWLFPVFIILLLTAIEFALRWKGYRPGYLNMGVTRVDSLIYSPTYYTDSLGIWKPIAGGDHGKLSNDGFFSIYDTDSLTVDSLRKLSKKIILAAGDSYIGTHDANNFVNRVNDDPHFALLNFGAGGADPLQYELIARHYIPKIRPDIFLVCFFTGNDMVYKIRQAAPGVPLFYETNAGTLIADPTVYTNRPPGPFATPQEAYDFMLPLLSLKSAHATALEKLAGSTAITTALYFLFNPRLKLDASGNKNLSGIHLQNIKSICREYDCRLIVLAIPSIKDCFPWSKTDLCEKYEDVFTGVNAYCLDTKKYSFRDYHSVDNDHFNERGNTKCAEDLVGILGGE